MIERHEGAKKMLYSKYPEFHVLEQGLSELGITLNESQKQQFIDYYEMLVEKNELMNLTAITEFNEVVQKHFIDSLSLCKVYQAKNQKILDLGTGAGFPGIPLKIVYPDLEILLVDSLKKRLGFLEDLIKKLDLKKIETLHGRAEDIGKNSLYREKYDLCVSRAVAKLSTLSEYCLPFVKRDGYFVAYKSGNVTEEVNASSRAFQKLGAKLERVEEFLLPGTDIERTFIMIKKTETTPGKYPRGAGKPTKEPL